MAASHKCRPLIAEGRGVNSERHLYICKRYSLVDAYRKNWCE